MNAVLVVLVGLAALALGAAGGFLARQYVWLRRARQAQKQAEDIIADAQTKQKEVLLQAKEESLKFRETAELELKERRAELQRQERRIAQKEEALDRKLDAQERRERAIVQKERETENQKARVEEMKKRELQQMEVISKMSSAEAKDLLMANVESEVREALNARVRELEAEYRDQASEKARYILTSVIQRCATDVISETTTSVVTLPSDEMKGRLIGREGRNIRALEAATGVDLIVDDTPEVVTLSCFDPVRREVARLALTKLISDGRIHPARIEEVVGKAQAEVEAAMKAAGESASYEAGVPSLHAELIKLLGRLKYRYSYGQNVLTHSLEASHFAGMLAAELGSDIQTAKTAGLLHDLGKAVDHEVEGPHAKIGAELVQRWIRSPEIATAIGQHHGEESETGILGAIVATADALSGGRPGARRESMENYLKRLEALETVANSFTGVEKAFAIQAGREVRIIVKPEEIDDLASVRLARDISKKIEETLQYPGQIKVTVVRETRAVEFAR